MGCGRPVCSILSAVFLTVFVLSVQASPGTISRTVTPSVVKPGGEVTVTLDVKVVPGERYYLIDETPPADWTIQDTGELVQDANNHLKIVHLQNAADKTYTYVLTSPSSDGPYSFSGIYQIDGMDKPGQIAGPATVTVSSAAFDSNILIVVVALIIAVAIVVLYLEKTKSV